MNLTEILQGANVALGVLQARLVEIVAMVLSLVIFLVAFWHGSVIAAIIAATWGLLIFLPVLLTGRRGVDEKASDHNQAPPQGG